MSRSLRFLFTSGFFLLLFLLPTHFNQVFAVCGCFRDDGGNYEHAAWGGNGGWWATNSNRDWLGDYDDWPGYQNHSGNGYSKCYNYCHCPHSHYRYSHTCYNDCRYQYYYDESVPGAGLYFNVR